MKKIILIVCLLLLTGCNLYYINDKSVEDIINISITSTNSLYNVNNKGYRYYLPIDFEISSDQDYDQVLLSKGYSFYLYVDKVSYYYKSTINETREDDDKIFYSFSSNNRNGFIHVKDKGEYFFVELCYNYAIIEVEVESKDLNYAVAQSISILNSIQYNDLVIGNSIGENAIEGSESTYEIPKPENSSNNNILEYLE